MWRSPEAIRDKSLMFTKEADMYSAGIVTAEILTRLEPYEEERNNMIVSGNSSYLVNIQLGISASTPAAATAGIICCLNYKRQGTACGQIGLQKGINGVVQGLYILKQEYSRNTLSMFYLR